MVLEVAIGEQTFSIEDCGSNGFSGEASTRERAEIDYDGGWVLSRFSRFNGEFGCFDCGRDIKVVLCGGALDCGVDVVLTCGFLRGASLRHWIFSSCASTYFSSRLSSFKFSFNFKFLLIFYLTMFNIERLFYHSH